MGLTWRRSVHDLDLLQSNGKSKSSVCSEELYFVYLYVFCLNNEIFIISIEEILNKDWESLRFYMESCHTKDFTCSSKANLDADVTILEIVWESYSEICWKKFGKGMSLCLTPLWTEISFESWPLKTVKWLRQVEELRGAFKFVVNGQESSPINSFKGFC